VNDEPAHTEFPVHTEAASQEMPVNADAVPTELPGTNERALGEMSLAYLRVLTAYMARMVVCLERAPWMVVPQEIPASVEPVSHERPVSREAVGIEIPGLDEPLPTWILTDEMVHHIEDAIEQEQRVRGRAYGGA
jgi:hypothetical protein